jgi:hypothetical protein
MRHSFNKETALDAFNRVINRRLCLTKFLLIVSLGCLFTEIQAQAIRIGLSGPFTGGSSPMGESMRNGVRLAVEEINSSGGINGLKFQMVALIMRTAKINNAARSCVLNETPIDRKIDKAIDRVIRLMHEQHCHNTLRLFN